jgi:ribosomal protein L31E
MPNEFERPRAIERAQNAVKNYVRAMVQMSPLRTVDTIFEADARLNDDLVREGVDFTPHEMRIKIGRIHDSLLALNASVRRIEHNGEWFKIGVMWLLIGIFVCVLYIAVKVGGYACK